MPVTDNITQEHLKKLLHYDPETGLFTRLVGRGPAKKGSIAGSLGNKGYICIEVDGVKYKAHRLAFLYVLGWMPPQVDHDDHVKSNNRWKNLNPANQLINQRNAARRKDNTSGITGINWYERNKMWVARISVNRKRIHLGYFTDKPDAIAARKAADIKYGFHENHGGT